MIINILTSSAKCTRGVVILGNYPSWLGERDEVFFKCMDLVTSLFLRCFLLSIFFIKFEKSNIYTFEKDEFSAELPNRWKLN